MDAGLAGKNTKIYTDISSLAEKLGLQLCAANLGLHGFTGCDYSASFMNKGKIRPYKLMKKSKSFQRAFSKIGDTFPVSGNVVSITE